MNREEFKAYFNNTAKPWLNRFHQAASDYAGLHPWAFWLTLGLAGVGTAWIMVKVIGWVL